MIDIGTTTYSGEYEITDWVAEPYVEPGSTGELSRVRAAKVFEGEISGTSTAELLMAGNDIGAGYVASEQFVGRIGERTGAMTVQHWGVAEGADAASSGHIIPGSGTEGLSGISGKAVYSQDPDGQHRLELRVTFPAIEE
ncbi:MAG: hypothetical protein JWM61_655 [Micrococcaceae bacterium]|jgi:hypothetical protein|uniref:DUF3224 domain-containing protein n=1 Tax=Arthrobacter cheniae TaxID=1258888 RepID=A0A3A5MGA1_9MICC|nr:MULTISPECIES: DUF3224 domain-containing protein [Arthrobacter]MCU1632003.1 hypothetical protein [Micrococcaceae bacterium]MEC5198317.1 hypothetical protein [Arthrobacter sp. PL16]RJT81968.1 DUF3224 domain-containing protein [Arthrobacter cheniae]